MNRRRSCDDKSVKVMDSGQWTGVSGVPGLGVSIPARHGRPVSACDPWDLKDHQRLHRKKKVQLITSQRDDDTLNSAGNESGSSGSSWTPQSLNTLSQIKLDLPRVMHCSPVCKSRKSMSQGKGSVDRKPSSSSASSSSSSSLKKDKLKENHSLVSQKQKAHLTSSDEQNHSAPQLRQKDIPWKDSVIKRTLAHRKSYHWDLNDRKRQHRPLTHSKTANILPIKNFSYLTAVSGPSSLPPGLDSFSYVPRAPIQVPRHNASSSSSEDEDEDEESHYESLSRELQPRRATFSDLASEDKAKLLKILQDKDGDYSYVYDCSLSPAFVIKYNEEMAKEEENIYEEINEVRRRAPSSSSDSSGNTDSGVHLNQRNFSSTTLDIGPKSLQYSSKKKVSRFSKSSSSSMDFSTDQSDTSLKIRPPERSRKSSKVSKSQLKRSRGKSTSEQQRSRHVPHHHQRVQEELRLEPDDFELTPNEKERLCSKNQMKEEEIKKSSLSKMKSMRFGLVNFKVKSTGSIKTQENNNVDKMTAMKRCESMDVGFDDSKLVKNGEESQKSGWLRKYSDAFNKKYLSRLSSAAREGLTDSKKSTESSSHSGSTDARMSVEGSRESPDVNPEESFTMNRHGVIQRSKIASKWQHLMEEDQSD